MGGHETGEVGIKGQVYEPFFELFQIIFRRVLQLIGKDRAYILFNPAIIEVYPIF